MNTEKRRYVLANEAPKGLREAVLRRIGEAELLRSRRRAWAFGVANILSAVALVPAFAWLWRDAVNSGFAQSLSLVWSDASSLSAYWRDFAALLVETLPYVSLIAALAASFAFLATLRSLLSSHAKGINRYAFITA